MITWFPALILVCVYLVRTVGYSSKTENSIRIDRTYISQIERVGSDTKFHGSNVIGGNRIEQNGAKGDGDLPEPASTRHLIAECNTEGVFSYASSNILQERPRTKNAGWRCDTVTSLQDPFSENVPESPQSVMTIFKNRVFGEIEAEISTTTISATIQSHTALSLNVIPNMSQSKSKSAGKNSGTTTNIPTINIESYQKAYLHSLNGSRRSPNSELRAQEKSTTRSLQNGVDSTHAPAPASCAAPITMKSEMTTAIRTTQNSLLEAFHIKSFKSDLFERTNSGFLTMTSLKTTKQKDTTVSFLQTKLLVRTTEPPKCFVNPNTPTRTEGSGNLEGAFVAHRNMPIQRLADMTDGIANKSKDLSLPDDITSHTISDPQSFTSDPPNGFSSFLYSTVKPTGFLDEMPIHLSPIELDQEMKLDADLRSLIRAAKAIAAEYVKEADEAKVIEEHASEAIHPLSINQVPREALQNDTSDVETSKGAEITPEIYRSGMKLGKAAEAVAIAEHLETAVEVLDMAKDNVDLGKLAETLKITIYPKVFNEVLKTLPGATTKQLLTSTPVTHSKPIVRQSSGSIIAPTSSASAIKFPGENYALETLTLKDAKMQPYTTATSLMSMPTVKAATPKIDAPKQQIAMSHETVTSACRHFLPNPVMPKPAPAALSASRNQGSESLAAETEAPRLHNTTISIAKTSASHRNLSAHVSLISSVRVSPAVKLSDSNSSVSDTLFLEGFSKTDGVRLSITNISTTVPLPSWHSSQLLPPESAAVVLSTHGAPDSKMPTAEVSVLVAPSANASASKVNYVKIATPEIVASEIAALDTAASGTSTPKTVASDSRALWSTSVSEVATDIIFSAINDSQTFISDAISSKRIYISTSEAAAAAPDAIISKNLLSTTPDLHNSFSLITSTLNTTISKTFASTETNSSNLATMEINKSKMTASKPEAINSPCSKLMTSSPIASSTPTRISSSALFITNFKKQNRTILTLKQALKNQGLNLEVNLIPPPTVAVDSPGRYKYPEVYGYLTFEGKKLYDAKYHLGSFNSNLKPKKAKGNGD